MSMIYSAGQRHKSMFMCAFLHVMRDNIKCTSFKLCQHYTTFSNNYYIHVYLCLACLCCCWSNINYMEA